jgi:hypothetical protein
MILSSFARCALPVLFVTTVAGCGVKPEKLLIGKWAGDTSAAGTAMRAVQLKQSDPGVEGSTAMKAARAMGAVALELREDKTFDLLLGPNEVSGTWTFDPERSDVQLDLKSAVTPPPQEGEVAEPFKPQTWMAHLDADSERLEIFQGDRESYDFFLEVSKNKKVGLLILTKQ